MPEDHEVSAVPEVREFVNALPDEQVTAFPRHNELPLDQQVAKARSSATLLVEMGAFIGDCTTNPRLSKLQRAKAHELIDRLMASGVD